MQPDSLLSYKKAIEYFIINQRNLNIFMEIKEHMEVYRYFRKLKLYEEMNEIMELLW